MICAALPREDPEEASPAAAEPDLSEELAD